ncbi:MAG: hypothetical protein HY566_03115 [Candidatus Kerfeldbacteria bacterium]|nr:hypothetical protein [Candidatus Kerfeldbacteria bacterium]
MKQDIGVVPDNARKSVAGEYDDEKFPWVTATGVVMGLLTMIVAFVKMIIELAE